MKNSHAKVNQKANAFACQLQVCHQLSFMGSQNALDRFQFDKNFVCDFRTPWLRDSVVGVHSFSIGIFTPVFFANCFASS